MENQTPPTVDQYAKLEQVVRDIARKGNVSLQEFQYVLGHPSFQKELETSINSKVLEFRQRQPIMERPPFMKVKLGDHQSTRALCETLVNEGNCLGDWGRDILLKTPLAKEPTEVDIVVVSVEELGFPNGATRAEIYDKALSMGLSLCPQEVGPQMRSQYKEQPNGEWILIGMEPITVSDGGLRVFSVAHYGAGRYLYGRNGGPGRFWHGYYRWAFCRK